MAEKTLSKVGTDALIIFLLLVLSVMPVMAESIDKNAPAAWVDRDRFPEAYSILTSDHIMFPDKVSNLPIKIDSKRQLFIDDYMNASMENLTRQLHQPVKHPANPLMQGIFMAVVYDEQFKKFRMWHGNMSYAESTDGINWIKADMGEETNKVFSRHGQLRGFIHRPNAANPEDRYNAVLHDRHPKVKLNNDGLGGFYLYRSADGIHWKPNTQNPLIEQVRHYKKPGSYWSYGIGDTTTFRYDTVLKRYICDAKFNLLMPWERIKELGIISGRKPRIKLRTFLESEDAIHWTRPRFYLYPDRNDPPDCQMYAHIGFNYESMWIGMLRVMHMIPTGWKQVDIQLSYSRDGRHWSRPRKRQPFIPLGGPDSWDADYSGVSYTGPFLFDDELWFYYFGSRNPKRDKLPKKTWTFNFGLAKLRRDGFASLDAGQTPGKITTRPITFKGKNLFVNADVEKDGWIKAAVLTRDSKPVESYTLDDSVALTKDTTKGRMSWKSKKELVGPGDKHLRLVFQLKNAKLYSFWIE